MADKIITEYITNSSLTPVVKDLKADIFPLFEALDGLQGMHKDLLAELETTYLLVANLTGLAGYHKTLLGNYGVHYTRLNPLFTDHYTACTDIINISVSKIQAAQALDMARLNLLNGLAIHKFKDIELTYYVTHDPTCRGLAMKIMQLDKQFKKVIEIRDKKFDMLHSMVYAMIRIQEEFLNTFTEQVNTLTGSSANLDFIKTIGERTQLLTKLLKRCIKAHAAINDGVLRDVFDSFERYRKYNNIDIGFKMEYVSDGTFDDHFKTYTKLSSALETTIAGLKHELVETESREKLGFDARQQNVLIATNPNIVAIEGKRAAVKKALVVRSKENIDVHTTIKECIKKQGAELKECIANLEGVKRNDTGKVTDYMKSIEQIKGMKGMLGRYHEINQLLAHKIVEIAQLQEKNTLNNMVEDLMKEKSNLTSMEQRLAEEKARFSDLERSLRERAIETGMTLPASNGNVGETSGNVLRKIQTTNLGIQDSSSLPGTGYTGNLVTDAKTKNYADASLAHGLAPIVKMGNVAFTPGLLPNIPESAAKDFVEKTNPIIYMTGGDSNLSSATWSNPLTGYSFQMGIVENGAYGHMLKREFENYDKCANNNKILIANALYKDMAVVRALPDSHPDKARLYQDLLAIQANVDNYAKIHACGLTYKKSIDGINHLGFDRIVETPGVPNTVQSDCTHTRYGGYTPAQLDEMLVMVDTYLDCYKTMLIDFDSRCRNIQDLCNKGKNTLDALVQDLSHTPDDLAKVKHLINDVHYAPYAVVWKGVVNHVSLKSFIFDFAKKELVQTLDEHTKIIDTFNAQIKTLEDLKLKYRYELGMAKQTGHLNDVINKTYNDAIKNLFKFIEDKTNCPCAFFDTHKPVMKTNFWQYFTYQQAIAQAIFIIYAHVERYSPHYLRSTQDRINHYAIMCREWRNCTLKCELVTKELERIDKLKAANLTNYDYDKTKSCSNINENRTDALDEIVAAYNHLMDTNTQETFKKFTSATRINVIPHTDVINTLEHLGKFQQGLNKYAQEVAKETNLFAEVAAQKSSACKTKTKLNMECLFADCQLFIIERFSLPVKYKTHTIGYYPEHKPNNPINCDPKTNFDFIRFLCRRMIENDRVFIDIDSTTTVASNDPLYTDVKNGIIIRG